MIVKTSAAVAAIRKQYRFTNRQNKFVLNVIRDNCVNINVEIEREST